MNNEFRQKTFLFGFEFYASQNGTIRIQVLSSNVCGQISCSSYLSQNCYLTNFTIIFSSDYQVSSGYNVIYLSQPIVLNKGNFIWLNQTSARIALDKTGNTLISDLYWQLPAWIRMSASSNWRFYFNALTNFSSYQNVINLLNRYNKTGLYNVSITLMSSNEKTYQTILVTDCKRYLTLKKNKK